MDKLYGFFDHWVVTLGGEKANYPTAYKIFFTVIGAFILWLILKRVLGFIEKREKKYEFVKINPQIYTLLRKVLKYVILLFTGAYLIRTLNAQLIENAYYA